MALIDFLLTQTATITPHIRYANGEDFYGEPETRKCRLQYMHDLETTFKNPDGTIDQVIARAKLFCTGPTISERSIIEVEGIENQKFIVLRCYHARGFMEDHLEVTLQ